MTIKIKAVYDPVQPDPANNIKGRASYKVITEDGGTYYCQDPVGQKLQVGHSYDNLDIKEQLFEGGGSIKWLNWAKGSFTPTQEPKSIPPSAPQPRASGGDPLHHSIVLQTIIKSCASHSGSTSEADVWLRWYLEKMGGEAPF